MLLNGSANGEHSTMKTGGILEGDNVWEDLVRDGMEVVIIIAQQPPRECIDGHRLKSRRNEHLFL